MNDKPQPRSATALVRLFVASILLAALLWGLFAQNTPPEEQARPDHGPTPARARPAPPAAPR